MGAVMTRGYGGRALPERISGAVVPPRLRLPRKAHRTRGVPVKLTHDQFAALAATLRETTTKILRELADQGLITLGRVRITVSSSPRGHTDMPDPVVCIANARLRGHSAPAAAYGDRPIGADGDPWPLDHRFPAGGDGRPRSPACAARRRSHWLESAARGRPETREARVPDCAGRRSSGRSSAAGRRARTGTRHRRAATGSEPSQGCLRASRSS